LIAHRFEVHVCAPKLWQDKEALSWLGDKGVVCHSASFTRAGLDPFSDVLALIKLRTLIARVHPNIFFGYTVKPVIWGGLSARFAGVPMRVALITGLGYAFTGEAIGKRKLIQRVVLGLYRLSLDGMHQIFFQNQDDRRDLSRFGVLPPNVKIDIVNGSGIDTIQYSVSPFPTMPIKFLLIARLLGDKGIREYALAAEQIKVGFPEIEFHLVGGLDPNPNGLRENEIEAWVKQGSIIWHGYQRDVRDRKSVV
jgi:glycosyltransferase involved in cell wall biosynthesis